MHAELLVLRIVHVLAGMFWVGSGLFTTFFLVPSLAGSPALMGPVMAGLQRRKLFTLLPIVAILTIASGARLMWIAAGTSPEAYFASPTGQAFTISGVSAILAYLTSLLVGRPSFQKAGALSAGLPQVTDEAERAALNARIARLRRVSGIASTVAVCFMLFAATGMGVARYVVW